MRDFKKEICKIFDDLSIRTGRWPVWADCMSICAICISNCVDKANAPEREEMYKSISKKYSKEEMSQFSNIFGLIIDCMEENPDQDLLGDLYMRLELGNKNNGQFFTPYNLCKLCAKMQGNFQEDFRKNKIVSVTDPACGAGALLIAYANECKEKGINYQQSVLFVGQDIEYTTACMCYIQLSLLGCPGYVVIGDTLSKPIAEGTGKTIIPKKDNSVWYTPMYFSDVWVWWRAFGMFEHVCNKEIVKTEEAQMSLFD